MDIYTSTLYSNEPITFPMNKLKLEISETREPVFILDRQSRIILNVNAPVLSAYEPFNPIGESFNVLFNLSEQEALHEPVYFNNHWLKVVEEPFSRDDEDYLKIILRRDSSFPDKEFLFTVRNTIAVLANRLRSPLTGMQGYLDMLEETADEQSGRVIHKIGMGLEQLFEIIDELELLHNLETGASEERAKHHTDPELIIRELIFNYPLATRNRLKILKPDHEFKLRVHPDDLKQILKCLLENAIEHPSGKDSEIIVDLKANECIKITNFGKPIPKAITQKLYFPFVTNKASNMGIGLTIAQILAKRQNGIIYLSQNSGQTGITFKLCLPRKPNLSVL